LDKNKEIEILKKALFREKKARKEAESFIESKSRELYEKNNLSTKLKEHLIEEVIRRTKKIEDQQKQFRELIENASDIIFTINIKGFFTYVNPVLQKISGYTEDELLNMSFLDLLLEDDKKRVLSHYKNQLSQNQEISNIEFQIITKYDEVIWINQTARLLFDEEGPKEYVVISRDVTKIKAANELVKQSEEKYRGIVENLELGILEVDKNDKIIKAYPKFCLLSGYSEKELLGKSPTKLFLERKSRKIMQLQNQIRLKGIPGVYEVPLIKKNNEIAWVIISGAPFYDNKGNYAGTVGIHLDITERRKMESDLREAKFKAEDSNRVKEMFLANMSHEIRTPLNAIMGMSELLEKSLLDSSQQNYLSAIQSSSSNLLALINDLLDFSKIESGKLTIEEISFNLKELVCKNKEILSFKADENGVKIDCDVDQNIPEYLSGDPTRLGQVLLNLLSNAVKFTHNGLVTITVKLLKKDKKMNTILFSIKDDGIGIDEKALKNIFDDFSQAEESTTRKYGGTGLGLSISKKIVNLMKGELKVKSKLNLGSEFFFTIDLRDADITSLEKNNDTQNIINDNFQQAKILLAEDNPVNTLLATTILSNWNCEVDTVENGMEAIEKIKAKDYDIILMDLSMPKMGGVEATEIIRKDLKNNTPIIALTANAIKGDDDKCIESGMNGYLSKPFKQIDLNRVLSTWINIPERINNQLYNLDKLKSIGDSDFLDKMVNLFLSETPKNISLMKTALDRLDYENVSSIAHKIKPSVNYVCVSQLYDDVKSIELWENSDSEMIKKTSKFIDDINLVLAQLSTKS
jgi:PAS domain S-box-containing protein